MDSQTQKIKSKGPLRFEAIIPIVIVLVLIIGYFVIFFDTHLRWGLERGLTQVNQAEVNIGSLKTSFIHASLEIRDLEFTDASNPSTNSVQIENIQTKLSWDALLRGKILIELVQVEEIQIHSPRKHAGSVTPKAPAPHETEPAPQSLSNAASLVSGSATLPDPQNISADNLKSSGKIEELKKELSQKDKEWSLMLSSLPTKEAFSSLQKRISMIKVGGSSDPAKIQSQLNEVQSVSKEADALSNQVKATGGNLSNSLESYNQKMKSVDDLIKADQRSLESQLKIPSLDVSSLAKEMFAEKIKETAGKYYHYYETALKYAPARKKDSGSPEPLAPPARSAGRIYQFPKKGGYPLFWLKKMDISSTGKHGAFAGDVKGTLADATSDQGQIDRATTLDVRGDFPDQGYRNAQLRAALDVRRTPVATFSGQVGSFSVSEYNLSQGSNLKFGFKKANGSSTLKGEIKKGEFNIRSENTFTQIDYDIGAESSQVSEMLKNAVKDIPKIQVKALIRGTWDNLSVDVQSNLADALKAGFEKQLKAKVDAVRAKIQAVIDEKVGKQKQALASQFQSLQGKYSGAVAEKTHQSDGLKASGDKKVEEIKKQATKSIPGVEDVRKKLGF